MCDDGPNPCLTLLCPFACLQALCMCGHRRAFQSSRSLGLHSHSSFHLLGELQLTLRDQLTYPGSWVEHGKTEGEPWSESCPVFFMFLRSVTCGAGVLVHITCLSPAFSAAWEGCSRSTLEAPRVGRFGGSSSHRLCHVSLSSGLERVEWT